MFVQVNYCIDVLLFTPFQKSFSIRLKLKIEDKYILCYYLHLNPLKHKSLDGYIDEKINNYFASLAVFIVVFA